MSKQQFWILNLTGGVCALLILGTVVLGELTNRLNQSALAVQNQFTQAQQVQGTAQNLVSRIAQAGSKDPALQALLARHQVKSNPEPSSKPNP